MLPLLRGAEGKVAFHVVAPSLANYGFSGRVTKVSDGSWCVDAWIRRSCGCGWG
jgi:hypothetical protein